MTNDLGLNLRISQDGAEATAGQIGHVGEAVDGVGGKAGALAPLKRGFDEVGDAAQKLFFITDLIGQIGSKAADIAHLSDEWQSMKGRLDGVSGSQTAANADVLGARKIGLLFFIILRN